MPDRLYDLFRDELRAERPVALARVVRVPQDGDNVRVGARLLILEDGSQRGSLGTPALDAQVSRDALDLLALERSELRTYGLGGAYVERTPIGNDALSAGDGPAYVATTRTADEVHVFVAVHPAPPTALLFGAVHIAIPLARFARQAGFRVWVVDARQQLCTKDRFPDAEQLIVAWPDEAVEHLRIDASTFIAILTHDPKFDEPALAAALNSPARYIGAIGSRRTCRSRVARLKAAGVPADQIARIRGPIGLDLGSVTADEVALSIVAEMVAVRRGGSGRPMSAGRGT